MKPVLIWSPGNGGVMAKPARRGLFPVPLLEGAGEWGAVAVAGKGEIRRLWSGLRAIGYYDFQIKEMIVEIVGNRKLDGLSEEEVGRVIDHLEEQIAFARKCMRVR